MTLLLRFTRLSPEVLSIGDGERFTRDFSASVATLNAVRSALSHKTVIASDDCVINSLETLFTRKD